MAEAVGALKAELTLDNAQFKKSIQDINRELKVIETQFKASSTSVDAFKNISDKLRLTADSLTQRLDLQRQKVETLRSQYEKSAEEKGKDAKETQNLEIRLNKATAEMNKTEAELQRVNEELKKQTSSWENFKKTVDNASEGLKNAGTKMRDMGKTMSLAVTAPIVGIGTAVAKMSIDFNKSMANVATLIPGNIERVNELKKSVQDMAVEHGKSTDDLADGLYQVISAYGDTADTVKILEINAKAATAGLATTPDAINLTSAVTKGYGDTTAEAVEHVSDLAFQTVKLGQTTFPELAGSIGSVVPLAASLGVGMDELFGVMATGTGVTGNASEVSTQFRGILQSLMSPTTEMTKLLSDLGYESGNAMLEQLGLQGTINTIVKAAEDAGLPLQNYIGSIEGQTLALALSGAQADVFTEKLAAMKEASGATDEAFTEQTEGINSFGFALQQLKQELITTMQTIGDELTPILERLIDNFKPLLDRIIEVVKGFANMPAEMQNTILILATLAAAIGPVLIIFGQLSIGIGSIIKLLPILGSAFTALVGPIGIAIAAISAVIAIGVLLVKHWDDIKKFMADTWNAIANTGKNVWTGISNYLSSIWGNIAATAKNIWNNIKAFFAEWWETLLVVFTGPLGILVLLIVKNWENIQTFSVAIWNSIKEFFTDTWNNIKAIFGPPIEWIIDTLSGAWNIIFDTISNIWGKIESFFSNTWNNIKRIFDNAFGDMIESAGDYGRRIMESLKNAISSVKLPIPTFDIDFREGPLGVKIPDIDLDIKMRSIGDLIPGLADGGEILRGGTVLVGERGPELLNLPRGASVSPLNNGNTINNTYNIQGLQPEDVERAIIRANRRLIMEW